MALQLKHYLTLILGIGLTLAAQAQITVTDSRGEQTLESVPERVVVLNWSMAENLVELGVDPVGVADVAGYRKWVVRPELPGSVANVGKRSEPNMEKIASLEPDVIVLSTDQAGLADKMSRVAPVLFFDAFRKDHSNAEKARSIFLELGRLFEREDKARHKLKALEARLIWLRGRIRDHFGDELPRVTSVGFASPTVVRVFGRNSMPWYALRQLGLESAMPQPASQWGQTQRKVADLNQVDREDVLLYFKPTVLAGDLLEKPLWNALPVVEAGRVAPIEPTWVYGGAMSLRYLAENMTDALLTIEP
ncbi:iron-siderophore ABC transporter substrate-binding protein [Salicola sp. Rm-C-2C1-2]|uniref:iron-siderophore ABC transporter substrate-binding protein n=1 Tax=Salicola sp. Rm-C-2C1-2 TaxID=3141321 RepID=UPI0032E4F947